MRQIGRRQSGQGILLDNFLQQRRHARVCEGAVAYHAKGWRHAGMRLEGPVERSDGLEPGIKRDGQDGYVRLARIGKDRRRLRRMMTPVSRRIAAVPVRRASSEDGIYVFSSRYEDRRSLDPS